MTIIISTVSFYLIISFIYGFEHTEIMQLKCINITIVTWNDINTDSKFHVFFWMLGYLELYECRKTNLLTSKT